MKYFKDCLRVLVAFYPLNYILTLGVPPSSDDAQRVGFDVVPRQTDGFHVPVVLDVERKFEEGDIVVGREGVVEFVDDQRLHVRLLLRPLVRPSIVLPQHHPEFSCRTVTVTGKKVCIYMNALMTSRRFAMCDFRRAIHTKVK